MTSQVCFDLLPTPVGDLLLAARDGSLIGVWFHGRPHSPDQDGWQRDAAALSAARGQLTAFFAGARSEFDLHLAPAGTPFQHRVWAVLRRLPFGATASYQQLATEAGAPGAARAVGLAVGRNPLSIVVPCHRVLGADGRLTGYAGGLPAKRWLLDHEARLSDRAASLF